MIESEQLYLLRFRYGRTAEIFLAYKTFLFREIKIGDKNYCQTEEHVRQVTHTLLLTFYSFVYSLFDASGTDFISATEPYKNSLSQDGMKIRDELIDIWIKNKTALSKLRNNIGFHGGLKMKSHDVGYSALIEIHPQTSEFIMNHLALFFMEMDELIPTSENYHFHIDPDARKILLGNAVRLKEQLEDNTLKDMFMKMTGNMDKLYGT